MTTDNFFHFIDDDKVTPAIKPMTELHDKLVRGYSEDKELKLPKLIQSLEIRISDQVQELVKLENEIQDGNQKLRAVLDVIRKIALDKDVPKDISNNLIDTLDNLYGN